MPGSSAAGDRCPNCHRDNLFFAGPLGGPLYLICHTCGWRPEAVGAVPLPPKDAFWQAAQERGITREQFDREWEDYQRSRMLESQRMSDGR